MIKPKDHVREQERIKELESYSILDTLPEEDFDSLTTIAAAICGTHISLISLLDGKRQWFKSHHGLAVTETAKDLAFCAHAINDPKDVFEISDARRDNRFHDNPLVTGEPYVIFYAGVPLITDKGLPLGTLCVIDDKPKKLKKSQIQSLNALSKQVMNLFELRRNKIILENTLKNLEETNRNLEQFAYIAAHDLKSPLNNIAMLTDMFASDYRDKIKDEGMEMLDMVKSSALKLRKLIEGLLDYSKSESAINEMKAPVNVKYLVDDIISLHAADQSVSILLNTSLSEIVVNRTILFHILINLVSNAIKYNDKKQTNIEIGISASEKFYEFYVMDNGPGIAPENQQEIFKLFRTTHLKDKFGERGSGIGLAIVKKLIEKSGGKIQLESTLGKGSSFIFTLTQ